MSDHSQQDPQWKQVGDAVAALGGQATRQQVWEYLKRARPDIPANTVYAELDSVSVNSPGRTSHNMGKAPRRTDDGNRYDILYKVGSGSDVYYVPYDPKVHGVWEIYADPAATSTNKTSIRKLASSGATMTATFPDADANNHESHAPEVGKTVTKPVNKILFGPPGTGKTYHTVDEALRILDAPFLAENESNREALKLRFDALAQAGLLRFVTFHQSFSYEDFVEGIRAIAEKGVMRYDVQPGVFKEICEAARSRNVVENSSGIDIGGRGIWKMSLGDANAEGYVFDDCMRDGLALLGFGSDVDLKGVASRAEIVERLQGVGKPVDSTDYAVTALDLFVRRVKMGDLIVVTEGNLKFRAIGEVIGDYVHVDREGVDTYAQGRPVRWLRQYDPARPYADLMENRFSQMTIYELRPGSINLERLASLLASEQAEAHEPEARVLIIDEINRGNISRIFGELITLIEPSKREGCAEALSVTLPYSKERFSVPRNVHLIGTMNTADRSLAGLDVALRRRFEFVEMLPDVAALAGVVVAGVPIDALLSTMNQRIEVLLGRDYMLGHAYFLGLKESPSLTKLADVFRRQVLPLLQEYFFADSQKIAWVLNDHRKRPELQFLQETTVGMSELLGDKVELPTQGRVWTINAAAFDKPEAYATIIKAPQAAT